MKLIVGGKRSGKRGRGADGKTIVFGMRQREGAVRTGVVSDVRRKTTEPIVRENMRHGPLVHTDEWWAYTNLGKRGFNHQSVNHGQKEWGKGKSRTIQH